MKSTIKWLTVLATGLMLFLSCVKTDLLEIPDTAVVTEGRDNPTKGANDEGTLAVYIQNNAGNITLQVDSMEICNVLLWDESSDDTRKGSKRLLMGNASCRVDYGVDTMVAMAGLPVQSFVPWNPAVLPSQSGNAYLKIYGILYTYIANNAEFPLYSGVMYYPAVGNIKELGQSRINVKLYGHCPLYAQFGDVVEELLEPIGFSVTVSDWEE